MLSHVQHLRHDMTLMGFNAESVEKYQKWNSALEIECDQKEDKLRQYEMNQPATEDTHRCATRSLLNLTDACVQTVANNSNIPLGIPSLFT